MTEKYLQKYKISLKGIFSIPLYHFQSQFSIMGLRNVILQYNTLSMMCILVTGRKWRPQGGTQNKQRASVRLYWLPPPLTACRPSKYPVSASVHSTNSMKVFDALMIIYYIIYYYERKFMCFACVWPSLLVSLHSHIYSRIHNIKTSWYKRTSWKLPIFSINVPDQNVSAFWHEPF